MDRDIYRNWPDFRKTVAELDHMLADSVSAFLGRMRGNGLQEPDYTAALVIDFVRMAQRSAAFADAKVGGAYIHQRPKVTFDMAGASRTCELGDLLVLCRRMVDGEERFNAALMQLKMGEGEELTISSASELVQLFLYTKWPKFRFRYVHGMEYDIQPKTVTLGAQYMFVNRDNYPVFTHHIPQQKMPNSSNLSFGRFLADFVIWQNGRPITKANNENADNNATDEWSKLIWDIIGYNANAYFRRRNVGIERGQRNALGFLSAISIDRADNLPVDPVEIEINGEEGMGCSILYIDYAERQE